MISVSDTTVVELCGFALASSWGFIREAQAGEVPFTKAFVADERPLRGDKDKWLVVQISLCGIVSGDVAALPKTEGA